MNTASDPNHYFLEPTTNYTTNNNNNNNNNISNDIPSPFMGTITASPSTPNSIMVKPPMTMSAPKSNKNAFFAVEWLRASFELCDGAHIAREILYQQYADYCAVSSRMPMNSASFGKIIRSVFPSIATRRLGTRGNSK
jgi:hypothetical protein